jgi:hypothetical protein
VDAPTERRQTRAKRVKWTIRVLQNLSLERQTVQLIYLLTDFASSHDAVRHLRLELLVVTCIYLVVKLKGDLTPSLASFNDFVSENLEISRKTLLQAELQLLEVVPPHFALLLTFTEFIDSCFPALRSRAPDPYKFVTRTAELCMGFYLFQGRRFEFTTLCAAAILEVGTREGFPKGLTQLSVVGYFKTHFPVHSDQLEEITESFLEENRYIKDIFAQF